MTLKKMKTMRYLKTLVTALLCTAALTSCMDGDWDTPTIDESPFGNKTIVEKNVMTIADLKAKYSSVFFNSNNSLKQITDSVQIKGRVVGNDIGSNIYNNVVIDDGTGAILVCISQGGLYAYLPVGQEILVDLKDLYVGGYGQQPEIGMPYTNSSGSTYVSRMSRNLWQEHFRAIGAADASKVKAEAFDLSKATNDDYLKANCGKLMTISGVTFADADGKNTFAPENLKDAANCVNRGLSGISTNTMVVRTSSYADFAASKLPTGKVNITGVFTRYRNIWQILLRTSSDIETVK